MLLLKLPDNTKIRLDANISDEEWLETAHNKLQSWTQDGDTVELNQYISPDNPLPVARGQAIYQLIVVNAVGEDVDHATIIKYGESDA